MSDEGPTHLPDGRPIISAPSTTFQDAARRLGVSTDEVRRMVDDGVLRTAYAGQRISVPSLRVVARDFAKREARRPDRREARRSAVADGWEREDREDARRIAASERAHARRPAKGYGQPKDGLSARPASGGLPTLGKRRS